MANPPQLRGSHFAPGCSFLSLTQGHTRGSELIAQGQRVEIVQHVLGHRDIRSTLVNAELREDQVRATLEGRSSR